MSSALFAEAMGAATAAVPAGSPRSAALLLHGMGEADRAWILRQLSDSQRARIVPLLDELHAMGLPADADWTRCALPSTPPPSQASRARARIAAAPVAAITELLASEPPALVDWLMALGSWPWQTEVMAQLRSRRGAVFADGPLLSHDRRTDLSKADRALLLEVASRLASPPPGNTPWRPWFVGIRVKLQALTRAVCVGFAGRTRT